MSIQPGNNFRVAAGGHADELARVHALAPDDIAEVFFDKNNDFLYTSPPARPYSPANEELRWADHIVNEATKNARFLRGFSKAPGGPREGVVTLERLSRKEAAFQLEKLSKSDDWWVRLYVAEILRQHPAFRTPELVARLAADKHPLVQEAMGFATAKAKTPAKPLPGQPPPKARSVPPAKPVVPEPAKADIPAERSKGP